MAEVFGAVASGAGLLSLAIQLGESAVKLKRFYDEVERAPRRLQSLAREIDLFSNILRSLENVRLMHGVADSDVLTQCIEMCEDSTRDIVAATTKIETMGQRSRLTGRVYAAVKMPEIIGLCNDMERSKNSLSMAFQMFHGGLLSTILNANQAMSVQLATLTAAFLTAPPQPVVPASLLAVPSHHLNKQNYINQHSYQTVAEADRLQDLTIPLAKTKTSRAKTPIFRCRVPSPFWFKQMVWDISVLHSKGRWTICLQTENLVPEWAPVFFHVEQGDVIAVRQLFEEGQASPYDFCYKNGWRHTLIQAAAKNHSVDMVELILDRIHPEARGHAATVGFFTLSWLSYSFQLGQQHNDRLKKAALYLLARESVDVLEGLTVSKEPTGGVQGRSALPTIPINLHDLEKTLSEYHYQWSAQDWLELLSTLSCFPVTGSMILHYCLSDADFDALLGLQWPRERRRSLVFRSEDSILHYVAKHASSVLGSGDWRERDGWVQLLTGLLEAASRAASLHWVDRCGQTPFQYFLQDANGGPNFKQIPQLVPIWSEILRQASIDVDHFFEAESATWKAREPRITIWSYGERSWPVYMQLKSLDRDPSTSEWIFGMGCFAGIYTWELQSAPGSWPSLHYLPQRICWEPREWMDDVQIGTWRVARFHGINLTEGPWLQGVVSPSEEILQQRGRKVVQDDGEVFRAANLQKFSNRRTASEPPSLPQAYHTRQLSVYEPENFCWLHSPWCRQSRAQAFDHWSFQNETYRLFPLVHGETLCDNPICCMRNYLATPCRRYSKFSKLVQRRKDFMALNGAPPAICDMVVGPSPKVAQSRPDNLVNGKQLFHFAVEEYSILASSLCDDFPDCIHQKVHLDRLRQEKEYQSTR